MRTGPHLLWLALLAAMPAAPPAGDPDPPPPDEAPHRTDLREQTRASLAQIHVTVTGPREAVSDLDADDFRLKVQLTRVTDLEIDSHCYDSRDAGSGVAGSIPVSYLFYFDQMHLTLPGRQRALDLARQLVPQLLVEGSRATIFSNARSLVTVEPLTGDVDRLLAALDRLEQDRTQWDFYATEEPQRIARVVDALNEDDDVRRAISIARTNQREEHWRTDKNLRRLTASLGTLSEIDSHRAVIYFADTLRSNAGSHYLSFFGNALQRASTSLGEMALDGFTAGAAFDSLINEATALGIRLHTVLAEGLVMPVDDVLPDHAATTRTGTVASPSRIRFHDAQNTLGNMARETGGHSFLRGAGAAKIAEHVLQDRSCMYTLSFDPEGFPRDQPLRVVLRTSRDGVSLRSQGRIVLQSTSARLVSRLTSAFTNAAPGAASQGLQAILVPTGFDNASYHALLQVSVPGTRIPATSWNLGATIYVQDKVLDEVSRTVRVPQPGVRLILEREVRLRPGPHDVVAVAHESTTGFVLSEHVQVSWPNPNRQAVTCGPIVLLQPAVGAFVRSGESRSSGSLARPDSEPVRPDLPVALMGLVCGARRHKGMLVVERSLIGDSAVKFPPVRFDLAGERCAQVRDLVPAGSLGPGGYRYELRVLQEGTLLDGSSREFWVEGLTPEPEDS